MRLERAAQVPWLHAELARRMAEKLSLFRQQPDCIIDWWACLGGGRAAWSARYPHAQGVLVEPDPETVEASRRASRAPWWRLGGGRRFEVVLEAETRVWEGRAGLLWANLVSHHADDVPGLLARWHRALQPQGLLLFSTFGPDTVRELTALYRRMGWGAPTWPQADMHDLGDALVQAGFADPVMDMEHLTLTWPDATDMLQELRGLGGNVHPARFDGLRTPRWRERLLRECESGECRRSDGRVGLTFEVVYGHAVRGSAPAVEGQTHIALGDLKAQLPSAKRKR